MSQAYLLLGSNEGDRAQWFRRCTEQIEAFIGKIVHQSGVYETAAWGLEEQPDFLNMAVCVETKLEPKGLLSAIQQIEANLERQRTLQWGQRTLDIDILLFDDRIIEETHLQIPHPFLPERRFALVPLAELAGTVVHPIFNKTIAELLDACPDPLEVHLKGQLPAI